MIVKLLNCRICHNWYRPQAHNGHCPVCCASPIRIGRFIRYVNWVTGKEIVRSLNQHRSIAACFTESLANALD